MTREEALKTLIDNAENGYVDIEEVKLVFSALEQEACEDVISRQAAIDAVIEAVDEWDSGYILTRADVIADAINNNVPSAQPDVPDTNVGDIIRRQAAIDAIKKIHPVDTEYDCTLYDKIDVMYVLKDLPSVSTKKTGH